jgi:hypothetical protein
VSPPLPGWTCPGLDRLARVIRRHVPEPDQAAALLTLEQLRLDHALLREAASGREPVAGLPGLAARVQQRLDRYDAVAGPDIDRIAAELAQRVRHRDGVAPSTWPPEEPTIPPGDVMNFGEAIEALKAGKRVSRAGWNGKGMWLALTPGSTVPALSETGEVNPGLRGAARAQVIAENPTNTVAPSWQIRIGAHIDMRAADGTLVIGWLASQTDMLADDWGVVE